MYILVTKWDQHWQDGQRTYYKSHQIHVALCSVVDGSEALFIKLGPSNRAEGGWRGKIHQVQPSGDRVSFVVRLVGSLSAAEITPYENFRPGWFETSDHARPGAGADEARLVPPFISDLETTSDPAEFEALVHKLVLLLGIHRAYRFPSQRQAGQADGFFTFGNLAVIYDCSLATDLEARKKQQLQNYCNQLLQGHVEIPPNVVERVGDRQKQVWVVSPGRSRILRTVLDQSKVVVKEVAVADLKAIFVEWLTKELSETALEERLISVGSS
jgi:hypothetical protein